MCIYKWRYIWYMRVGVGRSSPSSPCAPPKSRYNNRMCAVCASKTEHLQCTCWVGLDDLCPRVHVCLQNTTSIPTCWSTKAITSTNYGPFLFLSRTFLAWMCAASKMHLHPTHAGVWELWLQFLCVLFLLSENLLSCTICGLLKHHWTCILWSWSSRITTYTYYVSFFSAGNLCVPLYLLHAGSKDRNTYKSWAFPLLSISKFWKFLSASKMPLYLLHAGSKKPQHI